MKVVGLLSGGKDSCYNLLHCIRQGHQVVALATLAPPQPGTSKPRPSALSTASGNTNDGDQLQPEDSAPDSTSGEDGDGGDEMDSYMYQTVGHDVIHLIAQAMQLPLYRRTIQGVAINQGAEYGSRSAEQASTSLTAPSTSSTTDQAAQLTDETEDLFHLLMQVKQAHPDIEAVSVGAILSNYQRVRVEHVCLRSSLNLQPLCYLWQRPQSTLYQEMLQSGQESILIKVAGIGLTEKDLGKTLHQMETKLFRLNQLYGAHICGEGGEYETLTLDSPIFHKRIQIQESKIITHSESAFGSVSYLKITQARLMDKPSSLQSPQHWNLPTPNVLDKVGEKTLRAVQRARSTDAAVATLTTFGSVFNPLPKQNVPSILRKGRWLSMSNITGVRSQACSTASSSSNLIPISNFDEGEVRSAFRLLAQLLSAEGLDTTNVAHINLHLSSQALFPAINAIYKQQFGVSPPTRACLALPAISPSFGGSANVSPRNSFTMQVIAFDPEPNPSSSPSSSSQSNKDKHNQSQFQFDRRSLHVQSRSFWAPANIGPYSQSVIQAEKIFIAGQIGLLPTTLTLPWDAPVSKSSASQQGEQGVENESEMMLANSASGREMEIALSLQHVRRIFTAVLADMGSRGVEKAWIEGGICWLLPDQELLSKACAAWRSQLSRSKDHRDCHDPEDDVETDSNGSDSDGGEEDAQGCWLGRHVENVSELPPLLFVSLAAGSLPKNAAIEWQFTAHTGRIGPSGITDQGNSRDPNHPDPHPDPDSVSKSLHSMKLQDEEAEEEDEEEDEKVGMDASSPTVSHVWESLVLPSPSGNGSRSETQQKLTISHQTLISRDTQSSFGILSFAISPDPQKAQVQGQESGSEPRPLGIADSKKQLLTSTLIQTALQDIKQRAFSVQLYYTQEHSSTNNNSSSSIPSGRDGDTYHSLVQSVIQLLDTLHTPAATSSPPQAETATSTQLIPALELHTIQAPVSATNTITDTNSVQIGGLQKVHFAVLWNGV